MKLANLPKLIVIGVLAFLFLVNVYRAATQSATTDEAHLYNTFLNGGMVHIFTSYDATNHVLQSALSKVSIRWFGLSEFAMRIPTLLGGLLFLFASYRICRRLLGTGWLFVLAWLAIAVNPFVLDYLSVARGYGLALGLFVWALDHLMAHLEGGTGTRHLEKAGVGFALAVAANLIFVFPVATLLGIFVGAELMDGLLGREQGVAASRFWQAVDRLVVPFLVLGFVILVLPLTKASTDNFYYGAKSLEDTARSIITQSYLGGNEWSLGLAGWKAVKFAADWIVPALILLAGVGAVAATVAWLRAKKISALDSASRFLLMGGGAVVLLVAGLIAAHRLAGVPYPLDRTGIYFVPLVMLVMAAMAHKLWAGRAPFKAAAVLVFVFLGCSIVLFARDFTTTYYRQWIFDRSTKTMMRLIASRESGRRPQREVQIGVTWMMEPTVNFYRRKFRLEWMKAADRKWPGGQFDYYLLNGEDRALVQKDGLKVLYNDPVAETLLAAK